MPLGGHFSGKEMLITRQIMLVANFRLRHRHRRLILHEICHFQPFVKVQVSKNSSCAKIPKMSNLSCLGNLRLRCVRTVVSGTKPFSLNCLIRTFIPSEFQ